MQCKKDNLGFGLLFKLLPGILIGLCQIVLESTLGVGCALHLFEHKTLVKKEILPHSYTGSAYYMVKKI